MRTAALLLRRQRTWILAWSVVIGVLALVSLPTYARTYASPGARRAAVVAAQRSTASTLVYGRLRDPGTSAQMYAWEIGAIVTMLVAVMGVLLTARLTRDAEQDGTLELIRSCGVGPAAPAGAAAMILAGAGVLLGLLVTGAVAVHGDIDGVSWSGAWSLGGCVTVTFVVVAALTMLLAQAMGTAGALRGAGMTVVGAAFAVRGIGDVRDVAWLRMISPLGLRGQVVPFTDDRVVPLLAWGGVAVVLLGVSVVAAGRRDLGSAWIRPRDTGIRRLRVRGPLALTVRLARGTWVAWAVALGCLGTLLAAMGSGVIDSARQGRLQGGVLGSQVRPDDAVTGYFTYLATLVGVLVAVNALQSVLRYARDERGGVVAAVRSTGVRPRSPLAADAVVAAVGSLLLLVVAGGVAALVAARTVDADGAAWTAARVMVAQWPAVVALSGVSVLGLAVAPRIAPLVWAPWAASAVVTLLGRLLRLPDEVISASAFGHAPSSGLVDGAQLLLLAIGLGCLCLGVAVVGRRDVVG